MPLNFILTVLLEASNQDKCLSSENSTFDRIDIFMYLLWEIRFYLPLHLLNYSFLIILLIDYNIYLSKNKF